MLWDRAVPRQGTLLSSSSFGEDGSGRLVELVTRRWFEHVRFVSHLPWLFHFNNSQCCECTVGHGFMGAFCLLWNKK